MSGYVFAQGHCWCCRQVFSFNPDRVPSFTPPAGTPGAGERQPLCADCVVLVNRARAENGVAPIVVYPDSYGPLEAGAL